MSKCKLCNKSYSYNKYKSFGRGCLNKMYKVSDIKIPKNIKDKETYLISKIARRLKLNDLNKEQKRELSELYLANCYIDKIDYIDMSDVKEKLKKMLDTANMIMPNKDLTMLLYAMYKLYKATDTFKNGLHEIETMEMSEYKNKEEFEEIKKDRAIINGFKYIFDTSKISNPALYTLNYYRQYAFWKTVVTGGLFLNYKLASQLLKHSLSVCGEQLEDFIIYDSSIIQKIMDDKDFNNEIRKTVKENNDRIHLNKKRRI